MINQKIPSLKIGSHPIARGLKFDLPLNDNTSTPFELVNHVRGALTGTATVGSGGLGGGLSFSGANTNYVDFTEDNWNIVTGNYITMESWVILRDSAGGQMFSKPHASGAHTSPFFSYAIQTTVSGGRMWITTSGNSSGASTTEVAMSVGVLYHMVGVYDADKQLMSFYLNGVLRQTGSASGTLTNFSGVPLRVTSNGGGTEVLNGTIYNARMWNRALTATEILTLYRNPFVIYQPVRRFFSFIAQTTTSTSSSTSTSTSTSTSSSTSTTSTSTSTSSTTSTSSSTSTSTSTTSTSSSTSTTTTFDPGGCRSLLLDGTTNSYATWTGTNLDTTDPVTISVWAKLDADGANIGSSQPIIAYRWLYIHIRTSTNQAMLRFDETVAHTVNDVALGSGDFTWHHYVGVYEPTGGTNTTMRIYRDGKLKGTSFNTVLPTSNKAFAFGRDGSGGIGRFVGQIDDARVYHTVLSDNEVLQLYRTQTDPYGKKPASKILFDEGYGTTSKDYGTNKNDPVLQSQAKWGPGYPFGYCKFSKAPTRLFYQSRIRRDPNDTTTSTSTTSTSSSTSTTTSTSRTTSTSTTSTSSSTSRTTSTSTTTTGVNLVPLGIAAPYPPYNKVPLRVKPSAPLINKTNNLTKGLVLDIPFFEKSGAPSNIITREISTLIGSPTWVTTSRGSAFNFNGSTDYMTFTGTTLTAGEPFAMQVVFTATGDGSLFGTREGDPTQTGKMTGIRIISGIPVFEHDFLADTVNNKATALTNVTTGNIFSVIGQYDGTNLTIWVNESQEAITSGRNGLSLDTVNNWSIGRRVDFNAEYFTGSVLLARVWKDRIFTQAEIRSLSTNPLGIYTPSRRYFTLIGFDTTTSTSTTSTSTSTTSTSSSTTTSTSRTTSTSTTSTSSSTSITTSTSRTTSTSTTSTSSSTSSSTTRSTSTSTTSTSSSTSTTSTSSSTTTTIQLEFNVEPYEDQGNIAMGEESSISVEE